ncbi:MAG: MBL fold metallo-hydrolase [Clostridia bacterium]|nr:MBL fold metallo-hydrolase [Clostridia bacterium]
MKKNTKQKLILAIILAIVVILCGLYIKWNEKFNNQYDNISISKEELNIFYFNVGQADCTLITINGKSILIDAGNKSDGKYIVEFLKEKRLENIDYFFITHGDMDHRGGAEIILDNCNVKQIFMPEGIKEAEEDYQDLEKIANRNNKQLSKIETNDKFNLDRAEVEILSVKNNTSNSANESSIVIKLNYLDTSYLFMGDATQDIESEIECSRVDVLKVGHHGSDSSTSKEFLNRIRPTYAIISAGNNKQYNHPTNEVLQRLKDANIQESNIFITKNQGTIWITSDGKNIEIQTRKDINLDGTSQIGQMSIYNICSFFNSIVCIRLASQQVYIDYHQIECKYHHIL